MTFSTRFVSIESYGYVDWKEAERIISHGISKLPHGPWVKGAHGGRSRGKIAYT